MTQLETSEIGTARTRADAWGKVTGTAAYAYEHPVDQATYGHLVLSSIARGRVTAIDTTEAFAQGGVLDVVTHENVHPLADTSDTELSVLQSDQVGFRGQIVAIVVAEDPETAREAARLVQVTYDEQPHEAVLDAGSADLYAPEQVNPAFETDTDTGDVEAALAAAAFTVDAVYETPVQHNSPMEPHQTVATWDRHDGRDRLVLLDSTQGVHPVRTTLAPLFALDADQVEVVAPFVGGGFGSKGMPHANVVAAALAARHTHGRPVKLPLTRQQTFTLGGHRTPTVQRVRLGADADGRLAATWHEVVEHTSRVKEFAEQTAVATRLMYDSPNRRTSHRLHALDVPVASWMRAPGEAPGSFALELAMDELAVATGVDPVELRVRNDPESDPESGNPWSQRHLVECLREGADRFGWQTGVPPRTRRQGRWLVGQGVASATYPLNVMPGNEAEVEALADGRLAVSIGAVDIGTGARTILAQIAADALGCPVGSIDLRIGDTTLPFATVAGGSAGTTSWGTAIVAAGRAFREQHGDSPAPGSVTRAGQPKNPDAESFSIHSFGAHFVEAHVDAHTGEVRVPRMVSVFSAGRIINPTTARSQLLGGMVMGLSAALHEETVIDPSGLMPNHDLAQYHVASHADIGHLEAHWLDEVDVHANPMGSKGIGEIGIVGAAAAVANATFDATGVRVRSLPLTADKLGG
ncbi:xanthine dehydrogenase family protein molybdopterin-binding subunit [Solicola sp. PLA-1-18]|uniref:xanthine dehydrogenase family protein molybdopterin-binding subunit n=1 Tax=Solicola sp. PLA-1-18 TaxID=3380532 RepID=UPI003B81C3BB